MNLPGGILKINAPMSFGTLYLGKAIAEFMTQYSELQIRLTLSISLLKPTILLLELLKQKSLLI